ncbi:MAG TPA: alpha-glucan family phosphorylase [Opitutaceae bacterium]|nr:alpha-glucan family phosphorylase [Opitutaceae bacterium]
MDFLRSRLEELALDLRWASHHAAIRIWRRLDPDLWENTRNAWFLLRSLPDSRLAAALSDPALAGELEILLRRRRERTAAKSWFEQEHPQPGLGTVAYFCMEFMLNEGLPIYSGGLGNVAGDQLKAASDLGVPVVGVGLLYQRGYFRQQINQDETQQALYPFNDPDQLPIRPVLDPAGQPVRLEVALPGNPVWLRAWETRVGRAQLYLLDTNDPANSPTRRGIASELYGGGAEVRIEQEIVLGIGGWRLLCALGRRPEVCHLNEGHAAFAVLERAADCMRRTGLSFHAALAATRPGNLFTTHTAVAAGFDRFPPKLVEGYLGPYARESLGLDLAAFLSLGRPEGARPESEFNMAYLAVRGSGSINAVSRLHASVSRRIFLPLFPRSPEGEVPIGHITNGIHIPSWISDPADGIWAAAGGESRWTGTPETLEAGLRRLPAPDLWRMRCGGRTALVEYARRRLSRQLATAGAPAEIVAGSARWLDPNALTLGFARRFAGYKRPNLLLQDPQRLLRILTDAHRPVQLIIAGKAHPADREGQTMVTEWLRFIRHTPARGHAIFLSDYDLTHALHLVQGVDLWITTPRRPWEACGTSGMKVLANGGLNLSELDGWWAEAYAPEVGWSIGDGRDRGDDPDWDRIEALQLYALLEREIIPMFYERDSDGLPTRWLERMRESMARLTPRCSAIRAVRDYTTRFYLPAAAAFAARERAGGREAIRLSQAFRDWRANQERIHFGEIQALAAGSEWVFEVPVYLDGVAPDQVSVELYAEPRERDEACVWPMAADRPLVGSPDGLLFNCRVPASRPSGDYTPRVAPRIAGAILPLEAPGIAWAR